MVECSTFEPYLEETIASNNRVLTGTTRRKRGVRAVLSSLTPNHRNVLKVLLTKFKQEKEAEEKKKTSIKRKTDREEAGDKAEEKSFVRQHGKSGQTISWNDWLSLCLNEMIVSGEMALRVIVRELIDHQVVKVQRLQGVDLYSIENPKELQSWMANDGNNESSDDDNGIDDANFNEDENHVDSNEEEELMQDEV
jgi:hypothetical protein